MDFVNIRGEPIDFRVLGQHMRDAREAGIVPKQRRKPTVKRGYAAQPGTGPEGKTCRDCQHKVTCGAGHTKSWIKCALRKATWTGGEGTDILARSPACSCFVERTQA